MPRLVGALLVALFLLPAAPASAADKLLDTWEYSFANDSDWRNGIAIRGNTVLQQGKRYRLDMTGSVRFDPVYENDQGFECDNVWCHPFGQPIRDEEGYRGGAITVGYDQDHSSDNVEKFVGRHIPYEDDHSYEIVFKAKKSDKLFVEGPGNVYPRTGNLKIRLYEDDEDTLNIEWAIKKRYKPRADDSVEYPNTPKEVREPDEATFYLEVQKANGKPCNPNLNYRWKVDGKKSSLFRRTDIADSDCEWQAHLDTEHAHDVEVSAKWGRRRLEADEEIQYRDILIVGIGDSAGSGEGVPLYKGLDRFHYEWENARCHRSPYSQQAIAAEKVENADKHSVVTFVHLACSGATIEVGLIGGYEGIEPRKPDLPAQVDEMYQLIGDRTVDALEISIGVNHGEFGEVVGFCVSNEECMTKPYKEGMNMASFVTTHLGALPTSFRALADRLKGRVSPSAVYLSHYPDLLRDDKGNLCQSIIDTKVAGEIDAQEIRWLDLYYANPLAAQINQAAVDQQWTAIQGAQAAFRTHGYCADDHWIRQISESYARQFDKNGAMHPNWTGHAVLGKLAGDLLKKRLLHP